MYSLLAYPEENNLQTLSFDVHSYQLKLHLLKQFIPTLGRTLIHLDLKQLIDQDTLTYLSPLVNLQTLILNDNEYQIQLHEFDVLLSLTKLQDLQLNLPE